MTGVIKMVKGGTHIEDVWEQSALGIFGPLRDEVTGGLRKLQMRWEGNSETRFNGIDCEGVDGIYLA
jgi:hypothetical protein